MSSRVGRWKREDEAAGEHRVRGRRERGMRPRRERERERKKERDCAEVSHPCPATRQLPHFPFSSRVCPMLLRFRVGSGPTEPPSIPLPRTVLYPLYSPPRISCFTLTALNGDSHHPAHAGLARWRRVVVMCTRTTRLHVHAGTHVQPDRCLNPHTSPSQIPPLRLLSSSGFSVPYPPFGP